MPTKAKKSHTADRDRGNNTTKLSLGKPYAHSQASPLDNLIHRAEHMPDSIALSDMLRLKRAFGNQAVTQLLGKSAQTSTLGHAQVTIQPILMVGPADDKYEREADATAKQVLHHLSLPAGSVSARSPATSAPADPPGVLRQQQSTIGTVPAVPMPGQAGGAAPPSVAAAIQGSRGRGQTLDTLTQNAMEGALGADFSSVRIHTNSQSDTLNRSINARAFTAGNDIFFRTGEYDPGSNAGQQLLAHELTHTVQQGAAPVNVVQRALGLEFETGWQIFHETPSKNVGEGPLEVPYKKEESIYGSRTGAPGWSMETDGKDIEFVVEPPFDESAAGMLVLNNVMGTLNAFTTLLNPEQNTARLTPATHQQFFQIQDPNAVIVPNGDVLKAQLQATAGVRLDRIDDLFKEMGREGATSDLSSRQGTTYYANRAIAAANNADNAAPVNGAPASDKLIGFLTLLSQYIKQGEAEGQRAYAKDIAYAMARTDFASMFALLPEQAYFNANPGIWVTYVLTNAGFAGTGGSLLINQRIADGQDVPMMTQEERNALPKLPLTRGQWLQQISQGHDLLTQAETTNALAYKDIKGGNRVRAMGLLGGATDNVGGANLEGIILELRQMKRAIPSTEWDRVARGLLTYLIALNDQNTSKANAGQQQYTRT